MITLEQAKNLQRGDVLLNSKGHRWRVNGPVKTWKRDPSKVQVAVKHGLYAYDYVTEGNLSELSFE